MDRNRVTQTIARRVRRAVHMSGADIATVAQAADIATPDLIDRLEARVEFEIPVLVDIGGFLRVPTTELLGGAA